MHNEQNFLTELLQLFNHLTLHLHKLEKLIMSTQEELATQLTAVNTNLSNILTQLSKVSTEVRNATQAQLDAILALQGQLANGQLSPEAQAALDAVVATTEQLTASVQSLDDINPDTPAPEPTPEPVA
jgi:uncharacterized protein YicC (UPF0701 family)